MNTYAISFGVLMCLVAVNCRFSTAKTQQERFPLDIGQPQEGYVKKTQDRNGNHSYRGRRRQNNNYGDNYYQQPAAPLYQEDWRYIFRRQQDQMHQIYRTLEEIWAFIRRPAPPPQPIYVPSPNPCFPRAGRCGTMVNKIPNIDVDYPEIEDPSKNWGFVDSYDADNEKDSDDDGRRPISIAPVKPKSPSPCFPRAGRCGNMVNKILNIDVDYPDIEDPSENWGFDDSYDADNEKDSDDDGRRPISIAPVKPKRPSQLPVPNVDHGSSQAGAVESSLAGVNLCFKVVAPALSCR